MGRKTLNNNRAINMDSQESNEELADQTNQEYEVEEELYKLGNNYHRIEMYCDNMSGFKGCFPDEN